MALPIWWHQQFVGVQEDSLLSTAEDHASFCDPCRPRSVRVLRMRGRSSSSNSRSNQVFSWQGDRPPVAHSCECGRLTNAVIVSDREMLAYNLKREKANQELRTDAIRSLLKGFYDKVYCIFDLFVETVVQARQTNTASLNKPLCLASLRLSCAPLFLPEFSDDVRQVKTIIITIIRENAPWQSCLSRSRRGTNKRSFVCHESP